ncbi:MAG: pentapeptide repeat-containing protein [Pseudomonadota bacterium]
MRKSPRNLKFVTRTVIAVSTLAVLQTAPFTVGSSLADCSVTAGPEIDWQGCRKSSLVMTGTDFRGSNMSRADFSSSDLGDAVFDESDLTKTNLVRASLRNSTAQNAQFAGAIAYRTNFSGGNFSGSNFEKAEVIRANFENAVLENTNMSKGELSRVNFTGAKIGFVTFDYSNLARSDFRKSEISGPISMKGSFLFQTRLDGVDLSSVDGLAQWQLDIACGDADTKLPEGMTAPASWPCAEEAD